MVSEAYYNYSYCITRNYRIASIFGNYMGIKNQKDQFMTNDTFDINYVKFQVTNDVMKSFIF